MASPSDPGDPTVIRDPLRRPKEPEPPTKISPRAGEIPGPAHATVVRTPQLTDLGPASPPVRPSLAQFGEYELLDEIARGGMGVVYRARHRQLQRIVAIKMILSGRLADENEVKRFYNEAQAAAGLQHPNIVAIHELGVVNDQHYFSMEFVEGESLKDLIARDALALDDAAVMLRTMAEAIQFAHDKGVLHRDLKPQNVLVDQTGQPRITDFGLAKQLDAGSELTATGMILGTPNYIPEQAAGHNHRVGPASDVYGLGAVLFETLTGRPPFRAESLAATLVEVVENDPPAPRGLNPLVPRDLETICLKCLAKEPGARYASAADLAADLDLYLRGEPITARPLSTVGRVLRWSRHKPFLAVVCGTTAAFLIFHTLAISFLRTRADDDWFVWIATGLIAGWFVSGLGVDWLLASDRWRSLAGYAFAFSGILLFTIGMMADHGPSSAPILMMYSAPGLAALVMPSVPLVWFATGLAAASYLFLVLHARWFEPASQVSGEQAAAFLVGLVVMGMVTHLLLRRVRATGAELSGSRSGSKAGSRSGQGRSSRRGTPRA